MSSKELCRASRTGDDTKVHSILNSGTVDVNSSYLGCTPLHNAMYDNQTSTVTALLSYEDTRLEETDSHGWTGLHYACHYNSVSVIHIFGKDKRCTPTIINMKSITGKTAVMVAVGRGNLECVKEISRLEGIDFNTKNGMGHSLIDVARIYNHRPIVEFLKACGRKISVREKNTGEKERNNAVLERNSSFELGSFRIRSITDVQKAIEAEELAKISEEEHKQ